MASDSRHARLGALEPVGETGSGAARTALPLRKGLAYDAEDFLAMAMKSESASERGDWARQGLASSGELDEETQAMLLRQLYLSHYALGNFERAHEVAEQNAAIGVLPDVAHQDAARALQALGDIDGAVKHLRLAARQAPAARRAFHWWTLGSVLFMGGRPADAISAFERAARWGAAEKPLYQAHLALAKCHAGQEVPNIGGLIARLESCPAGQGYGRFVLGQLAYATNRHTAARKHLESFVKTTEAGRELMKLALAPELEMARTTLEALRSAS